MKNFNLEATRNPELFRLVDRHGNWERYYHEPSKTYLNAVNFVMANGFAKPRLADWYKKNTQEDIDKRLNEAGEKGSKVHRAIESGMDAARADGAPMDFGRDMVVFSRETQKEEKLSADEWDCLLSFKEFWTRHEPLVVAYEEAVMSKKYGYAGTTDLVAILTKSCGVRYCKCPDYIGKVGILDYKTGGVWESYGPQIAAYGNSDTLKDILKKFGLKAEYTALVRLGCEKKSTGGADFIPYDKKETATHWKEFLASQVICDANTEPFDPDGIIDIPDQFKVAVNFAEPKKAKKKKVEVEENLCGQPHNNSDEDCLKCGILKNNL